MNLFICPYHDWRKIINEGFRTRDAHLIEHFSLNSEIQKVVVINRPTTKLELYSKGGQNISGQVIYSDGNFSLYKINEKLFVIDFILNDSIRQVFKRNRWFFDTFAKKGIAEFVLKCKDALGIKDFYCISHNIYAYSLFEKISDKKYIFDAYDNLLLFPALKKYKSSFLKAYNGYFSSKKSIIVTNSISNNNYFTNHFSTQYIHLLTNGVDQDRFSSDDYEIPEKIKNIPSPIIGFGGKISHLIDVDLFEYVIKDNPKYSFVVMGQVLDKNIFKKFKKMPNVYYLGDIKYDEYPEYVKSIDIAIIPYVTGKNETGANTIKVYEFIAADKEILGTNGCGLESLTEFVTIADNKKDFSIKLRGLVGASKLKKRKELPLKYTWKYISNGFINILKQQK